MKWALPLLFFFLCLYLIAFPGKLRPELGLKPEWGVDVSGPAAARQTGQASPIPFRLGDRFGYLSEAGDLIFADRKLYGVAIDSERFINFSAVSGNLIVQDTGGDVVDSMEVRGYPVLTDRRLFLVSTNRAEITELDVSGSVAWKREYSSVITDMDSANGLIGLGLLDSRIEVLDSRGEPVLEREFLGSRIRAVYGIALSPYRAAVIHGLDPQHVTVFPLDAGSEDDYTQELQVEYRTSRFVRFIDDDYLLIESSSSLLVLDLRQAEMYSISTAGPLFEAGSVGDGLIWAVSSSPTGAELVICRPPDRVLHRIAFGEAAEAAMAVGHQTPTGNKLLVGIDRNIGMMNLVER